MKLYIFFVGSSVLLVSVGFCIGIGGGVVNVGNGVDIVLGGIWDWVWGDDLIVVVGGRMISLMRD